MSSERYKTRLIPSRHIAGLRQGVVSGAGSMLTFRSLKGNFRVSDAKSTTYALRSDFVRLGADMRQVIAREQEREKTAR